MKIEEYFWKVAGVITFPVWGALTIPVVMIGFISFIISDNKLNKEELKEKEKAFSKLVTLASLWIMGVFALHYFGYFTTN